MRAEVEVVGLVDKCLVPGKTACELLSKFVTV